MLLAILFGCATPTTDTGDESATSAGPEVWVVMDWADGEPAVALDSGYVIDFSVQLLPCTDVSWSPGSLLVGTAQAGHGLVGADALRSLRAPRVASLTERIASPLGHLAPDAGRYCEVFWLMSFTTAAYDTAGLPGEVDMLGESLSVYAEGPGLLAAASTGRGARLTIVDQGGQPAPIEIEPGGDGEVLRIVRDASALLAGVDLSGDSDEVGAAMLDNLTASAQAVRDH